MPDRPKTAVILLAVILLLQVGLGTAEDGITALTGRRQVGRALSLARPAPGHYALSLFGHDYRWSERLAGLGFEAGAGDRPGLALFIPGHGPAGGASRSFFTGRVWLGSVEAWREAVGRCLEALRRALGGGPGTDPPARLPGPGLACVSGSGV
ncbi:MAG: hypothetical protein ACYC9Q_09450 [Bacillota bacterium]